jgi:hypothetical protein
VKMPLTFWSKKSLNDPTVFHTVCPKQPSLFE